MYPRWKDVASYTAPAIYISFNAFISSLVGSLNAPLPDSSLDRRVASGWAGADGSCSPCGPHTATTLSAACPFRKPSRAMKHSGAGKVFEPRQTALTYRRLT